MPLVAYNAQGNRGITMLFSCNTWTFWTRAYAPLCAIAFCSIFALGVSRAFQKLHACDAQNKWEQEQSKLMQLRATELSRIESSMRIAPRPFVDVFNNDPRMAEISRQIERISNKSRDTTTQQRLAQLLAGWELISTSEAGERFFTHWENPRLAMGFDADFRNGWLIHYEEISADRYKDSSQPPWHAWSYPVIESQRKIASISLFCWAISVIAWLLSKKTRFYSASVSVLTAFMCVTVSYDDPNTSLTWQGILKNRALYEAVVMLLVSLCLLTMWFVEERRKDSGAIRIRFGLRSVFLVVSLTCVCFALGPYVCVFLVAALTSGVFFAILFSYARGGWQSGRFNLGSE